MDRRKRKINLSKNQRKRNVHSTCLFEQVQLSRVLGNLQKQDVLLQRGISFLWSSPVGLMRCGLWVSNTLQKGVRKNCVTILSTLNIRQALLLPTSLAPVFPCTQDCSTQVHRPVLMAARPQQHLVGVWRGPEFMTFHTYKYNKIWREILKVLWLSILF